MKPKSKGGHDWTEERAKTARVDYGLNKVRALKPANERKRPSKVIEERLKCPIAHCGQLHKRLDKHLKTHFTRGWDKEKIQHYIDIAEKWVPLTSPHINNGENPEQVIPTKTAMDSDRELQSTHHPSNVDNEASTSQAPEGSDEVAISQAPEVTILSLFCSFLSLKR